jgi:hypothetical protein
LWTFNQFLDYHRASLGAIKLSRMEAIGFQVGNSGRIVFRGSRPIPAFPAPHPGEAPPPVNAPDDSQILNEPPCAYKLTEEQFNGAREDGPAGMVTTAAQRIAAHGWKVVKMADGYVVPLAQQERGLIPLLLDAQAAEELVEGQRLPVTLTGTHTGPLTIPSGTVACLAGATVTGPVTVQPGATLIATGSTFTGPVGATGAAGFFLTGSTVTGPVRVSGTTGAAVIVTTLVTGPVQLQDNGTGGGAILLAGNVVRGPLRCTGNAPAPVNLEFSNVVTGPRSGQCALL